jgi:hypothetical protein
VRQHALNLADSTPVKWASDKQRETFEYGPFPQCASGGFGSGKTFGFCLKVLWLSSAFPNNRGIIARKVHKELKATTMSTFYKICPPESYADGRRADSEGYLRLNNGSEVLFLHMDDPETENIVRGIEINWFLVDQAEELDEELFDTLCARLGRWDKTIVPDHMIETFGGIDVWPWKEPDSGRPLPPTFPMLACNPDTELHWIYRRFHPDSDEYREKKFFNEQTGEHYSYEDLGYKMWMMDSRENRFLPKQNIDMLMTKDEAFVRRFVKGQWGIPEGQIHSVPKESIIEGSPEILEWVRANCILNRSFDHGDDSPACCLWWGVDKDGNVIFYREYYQGRAVITDHRDSIFRLSKTNPHPKSLDIEKYRLQLSDPAIFIKNQSKKDRTSSVADEYADCVNYSRRTAIAWQPADNDELGTRNKINEYLRVDSQRVNPFTGEKGSPRLFFIKRNPEYQSGCYHSIKETRAQRRLKIGSDLGRPIFCDDRDDTIVDHAYDPLRYAIAARPGVAPQRIEAPDPMSFNEVARRQDDFNSRGGFKMQARMARRRAALMFGHT